MAAIIFVERDPAPEMRTDLNAPMRPDQFQQAGGGSGVRRQAGDAIDHFVTGGALGDEAGMALQAKDLRQAWPVVQHAQQATGGERAGLNLAVAGIEGLGAAEIGWPVLKPLASGAVGANNSAMSARKVG
jgi:hypothetical protein